MPKLFIYDFNLMCTMLTSLRVFCFFTGYFFSVFCMVGIAKSFGILLDEFVGYFGISHALGALIVGVSGGVYTLAGKT